MISITEESLTNNSYRHYRILHLIDHLGPGGAQEGVLNLLKYSDHQRFSIEVAAFHGWEPYGEAYRALGIPVYSFSPYFSRYFLPKWVIELGRLLWRSKYEVLHCHLM